MFFDFTIPDADRLPTDIRDVLRFNAVTWNHDYQDACVEKLLEYDVFFICFNFILNPIIFIVLINRFIHEKRRVAKSISNTSVCFSTELQSNVDTEHNRVSQITSN